MKIAYVHAMLDKPSDRSDLKLVEIPLARVPENILQIIRNHDAFCASGIFGKQGIGDPEEYEKLVLEDENGGRVFEYFNKGISYMMNGTVEDRPVFQVFAHFQALQKKGHV
jgi:hypothetical protein